MNTFILENTLKNRKYTTRASQDARLSKEYELICILLFIVLFIIFYNIIYYCFYSYCELDSIFNISF